MPGSQNTSKSTNAANSPKNVAQLLLHYLRLEGAESLFGVPGGFIAQILKELEEKEQKKFFTFYVCRHETGAAFIAEGYYRATGRPGVVFVTSGPAATNALTGTVNAHFGNSAVVTITGEPNEMLIGRGVYQEGVESGLDISAVYDAAGIYSARVTDAASARTIIQEALRNAMSVPKNAVHLAIPDNISGDEIPDNPAAPVADKPEHYRAEPSGLPRSEDVQEVCDALHEAKRPIIFLGDGCREPLRDNDTYQKLLDIVERYKIPVMTTPDGKGLFPEDHELSLRVFGWCSCRWPQQWLGAKCGATKHDVLLVIGSKLGLLSTSKYDPMLIPDGKFIQVDIDQRVIGRSFKVDVGIVADAGEFIKALSAGLVARDPFTTNQEQIKKQINSRGAAIRELKKTWPFVLASDYGKHPSYCSKRVSNDDANGIEPAIVMKILQGVLDEQKQSMIFIDHANSAGWATHYLVVKRSQDYNMSLGMASMGFGVCPVIGAKLGKNKDNEDCVCVGLTGDGGFLMQGAEVSTASSYSIGVIWIVLEDNDLRAVTHGMTYYTKHSPEFNFEGRYRLGNPNLVLFAKGLGANAVRVDSQDELRKALIAAVDGTRKNMPQVIVVPVNRERVPPYYIAPYPIIDDDPIS